MPFAGFDACQLTLSSGATGWVINRTPAAVVANVVNDPSYRETASFFARSGDFVLYLPSLARAPESFINFSGPRPGITVIDTDCIDGCP